MMTLIQNELDRKRADAIIRIAQTVVGTSVAGAVPTPALETAKMLGIAIADAWMFWDVYKVYYEQDLSAQGLYELLGQAGVVIFTGGVVGYAAVKASQALISEALNIVPLLGWGISGLMTGTSTLMVGLGWMLYLEDRYRAQMTASPASEDSDQARPRQPLSGEPAADESPRSANGHQRQRVSLSDAPAEPVAEPVADSVADSAGAEADDDKIEALHPEGKRSVNIDRHKYEQVRDAILNAMQTQGEVDFRALSAAVSDRLPDFEGSVTWYVTTVKLDLEARGVIERVEGSKPQRLRIKE